MQQMYGSPRLLSVQKVIFDSHMVVCQPTPGGDALAQTLRVWAAALAPIPDEYLDEYFIRAVQSKKGGFMVNPSDIMEQWEYWAEQRKWDLDEPEEMRGNFGTMWRGNGVPKVR